MHIQKRREDRRKAAEAQAAALEEEEARILRDSAKREDERAAQQKQEKADAEKLAKEAAAGQEVSVWVYHAFFRCVRITRVGVSCFLPLGENHECMYLGELFFFTVSFICQSNIYCSVYMCEDRC